MDSAQEQKRLTRVPCDLGYIKSEVSGTCIKWSQDKKTWQGARDECKKDKGDLIKVLDEKMNQFLLEFAGYSFGFYWIGLNDIKEEGKFRWLDEDDEVGATFWHYGSSHHYNTDNRDCAEMLLSFFGSWKPWYIYSCSFKQQYICEKTPECAIGYYGEGCKMNCNETCAGQNNPCNPVNGTCNQGCDPGYQGVFCSKECDEGFYGGGCTESCKEKCNGDTYCNPIDGFCYCRIGTYGQNCSMTTKSSSWTKNGTIISAVLVVAVIAVSAAFALGSFLWRGRLSS
ncbi:hypothetical protein RRG08_049144 [Elysia crispata]|uniref:C-type lectin domain-containing protein n=1 Tax=Elysia crispata TaxID=231223 RepID=A0AAE0YKU0_9GAST|nr:hypothetical protein RRG08_049144 [Elysia crispata]